MPSRLAQFAPQLKAAGVSCLNISLDSPMKTGSEASPVGIVGIDAAHGGLYTGQDQHGCDARRQRRRGRRDGRLACNATSRCVSSRPCRSVVAARRRRTTTCHWTRSRSGCANARLSPAAMHGSGPARYLQVDDSALRIGFITPQSQHFARPATGSA